MTTTELILLLQSIKGEERYNIAPTTELIKLLQSIEFEASGRSREISVEIDKKYIGSPIITISDGCCGVEVTLKIAEKNNDEEFNKFKDTLNKTIDHFK